MGAAFVRWRCVEPGPGGGGEELLGVAEHAQAYPGAVLVSRGRENIAMLLIEDGWVRALVVFAVYSLCLGGVEQHQRVGGGETAVVGERIVHVIPTVDKRGPAGSPRGLLLLLLEIREHLHMPWPGHGHFSEPIIYHIGRVAYSRYIDMPVFGGSSAEDGRL